MLPEDEQEVRGAFYSVCHKMFTRSAPYFVNSEKREFRSCDLLDGQGQGPFRAPATPLLVGQVFPWWRVSVHLVMQVSWNPVLVTNLSELIYYHLPRYTIIPVTAM